MLLPETFQDIQIRLELNSRKSLYNFYQEIGVSKAPILRAVKILTLSPSVMHCLQLTVPVLKIYFLYVCKWPFRDVHNHVVNTQLLFMTDET
jgi:hypothetical protein